MSVFKVCKKQSGQDQHGDSFSWKNEEWFVSAESEESLQADISKVNGIEIYAGEHLYLSLEGEVAADHESRTLRSYLSGYHTPDESLV